MRKHEPHNAYELFIQQRQRIDYQIKQRGGDLATCREEFLLHMMTSPEAQAFNHLFIVYAPSTSDVNGKY